MFDLLLRQIIKVYPMVYRTLLVLFSAVIGNPIQAQGLGYSIQQRQFKKNQSNDASRILVSIMASNGTQPSLVIGRAHTLVLF